MYTDFRIDNNDVFCTPLSYVVPSDDAVNDLGFSWLNFDDFIDYTGTANDPKLDPSFASSPPPHSSPECFSTTSSPSTATSSVDDMFIPASQYLNLDLVPNDPTVMAAAIQSPQSITERKTTPKDWSEQVESTFLPSPATTVETPSSPQSPSVSRPSSAVVIARRGPGRPSKAQLAAQKAIGKGLTARASASARREMHNDSAMRSRIRLNSTIDELWDSVPKSARSRYQSVTSTWNPVGGRIDPLRELSRADKVAIALSYLRKLKGDSVDEMC